MAEYFRFSQNFAGQSSTQRDYQRKPMKHSSQHQTPVNHAMATNRIAHKQKNLNGSNQLSASSASNTNNFNAKVFQTGNSSAYTNKENKPNLHIS